MAELTSPGFTGKSLDFLEGLAASNDKAWFDENRDTFEEKLKRPFAALLEALSDRLSKTALPLRGSEATMFRMHRDVRSRKIKGPIRQVCRA